MLWLPPSHAIHDRKPVFMCTMCDAAWFTSDERARVEYAHHCATAHRDDVREHSLAIQAPGLFDRHASGDVEWSEWIDRNARAGNDPMRYMKTDDGKHSSGIGDG